MRSSKASLIHQKDLTYTHCNSSCECIWKAYTHHEIQKTSKSSGVQRQCEGLWWGWKRGKFPVCKIYFRNNFSDLLHINIFFNMQIICILLFQAAVGFHYFLYSWKNQSADFWNLTCAVNDSLGWRLRFIRLLISFWAEVASSFKKCARHHLIRASDCICYCKM